MQVSNEEIAADMDFLALILRSEFNSKINSMHMTSNDIVFKVEERHECAESSYSSISNNILEMMHTFIVMVNECRFHNI